MANITAEIQKLRPEQKKLFNKKLEEGLAEMRKKLEEDIKKYQEGTYVDKKGRKTPKSLTQRIPYTAEEWAKEMEKQKRYKNYKVINSFIDKVFFEDGALQVQMPKEEKKGINLKEIKKQQQNKNRDLASYIDKVFFEDGALQLENRV